MQKIVLIHLPEGGKTVFPTHENLPSRHKVFDKGKTRI